MRMIMNVRIPHETFNAAVRAGTVEDTIGRIVEQTRPEAVYFTEQDGSRGALLVVDVADASQVPALAEPWFLSFNADCEFRVAMTPEDLHKAGLDAVAEPWK